MAGILKVYDPVAEKYISVPAIQGPPGADGKDGTNGSDGYTPIKGSDYWTEADKAEMIQDVLAALHNGDEVRY